MAYRPDNPYNMGIGTPYLGNINMGQVPVNNIQLAKNLNVGALKNIEEYQKTFVPREPTGGFLDSVYEAEYNKIPKGISKYDFLKGINEGTFEMGGAGVFEENVGDLFPKGTFKGDWNTLGDADINLKQIPGSYKYNIDVDTENIKGKVLEDLEKKGWFSTDDQASLDDDFYNEYGYPKTAGLNFVYGPQMRFKQQQFMKKKKQDIQRRIREADKKRIEQEKIKTAQDNWKPTYNPASSHAEAQATGGDYHSGHQSTVDGQTTDWGPNSAMIARGGLAQYAPRGSYFNGGLASLYRHGRF
jgi:hypothetical protein